MGEDKRIRRTKQALYDALVRLLRGKDLRLVTVQELCRRANVHRATFYCHYADLYSFYEEFEGQALAGFTAAVTADEAHTHTEVYRHVVDYIYENAPVWSVLLSGRVSCDFHDRITEILEQRYRDIWTYKTGQKSFPPGFHLLSGYAASGFLAMIVRWLKQEISFPKELLVRMVQDVDESVSVLMRQYVQI